MQSISGADIRRQLKSCCGMGMILAVNYANERYRQAHPADPNARYDYLVMRDTDNVRHQYAVQRQDMETVMNILIQYAPQMIILEPKPL